MCQPVKIGLLPRFNPFSLLAKKRVNDRLAGLKRGMKARRCGRFAVCRYENLVEGVGSNARRQSLPHIAAALDQLVMAITKENKAELVKEFQTNDGDSGSPDVQIAILTTRINRLTEHMRSNKKDYSTRRGLLGMVSRRRRLLDYVRKHNADRYLDIIERLNIRK